MASWPRAGSSWTSPGCFCSWASSSARPHDLGRHRGCPPEAGRSHRVWLPAAGFVSGGPGDSVIFPVYAGGGLGHLTADREGPLAVTKPSELVRENSPGAQYVSVIGAECL